MNNPVINLSNKLLAGDKTKAAFVYSAKNRRYFTQFPSSEGGLLVTNEAAYLLMDFRYAEAASYKVKNAEVVEFTSLTETLKELLKKHGIQELYLEADSVSFSQVKKLQKAAEESGAKAVTADSLDNVIRDLRIIKTADEVEKIKAAQKITDAAFTHILPFIKEGACERDLALEIEFFMRKNGADGIAFELIVVGGKNSSLCHGVPGDYKIQKGDFVTLDTGALLNGYNSDMTRTVAVGFVSDEQRDIYETVLKAHNAAQAAAKPGVPCCDIDKVARDIINAKYPDCFGHGLGHGVGVEIHEWPRFSRLDSTPLQPGMVVTNEPGIYLAGKYGVRIEDMLLITKDGCVSLTNSPKELIIL